MARNLIPIELEPLHERTYDVKIPIFINRNTMQFFAEYLGEKFSAGAYHKLTDILKVVVEERANLQWKQAIEVQTSWSPDRSPTAAMVDIEFRRFEIAQLPTGYRRAVIRPFPGDPEFPTEVGVRRTTARYVTYPAENLSWDPSTHTKEVIEGDLVFEGKRTKVVIPWTETSWESLQAIKGRIEKARDQLEELIRRNDVGEVLSIGPVLLLG